MALIDTSVQHFINHVRNWSDTEDIHINFQITKGSLINKTLNGNMDKLQKMPVNIVKANRL